MIQPTEILCAKNDFIFKLIFGDEKNKDILASFINAVTKIPLEDLQELEIVNSELLREFKEDRKGILDVHAKLKDGTHIDIEIQIATSTVMPARSIYYLSKMYTNQIEKGDSYFDLRKCIAINIVDFESVMPEEIHTSYHFREDTEPSIVYSDMMEIHFLQLPYLKDKEKVARTDPSIIDWLTLITAYTKEVLNVLVENSRDERINKAAKLLEAASLGEKNRMLYEARMAEVLDKNTARIEGKLEGKLEGMLEGMLEGKLEVIKNMIREKMNYDIISKFTEYSVSEIEKVAKSMNN